MDYSEIILKGFLDENTRNFLEKYFLREYKIAKRDLFFEAKEFFRGCLKVIEGWEEYFKKEKFLYLKELVYTKNRIIDGTTPVNALDGKTIEESKQYLIDCYENKIRTIDDSFVAEQPTMPLGSLTNWRVNYNITYAEVMQIKDSIKKAHRETLVEEDLLPFVESLLSQSTETETLSDLITHPKSIEIVDGIKIQQKGIRGKNLKILFVALQDLQLLPSGRICAKFYRCCKNTFDWDIATPQSVNDYQFKSGTQNPKGIYIQSDDEETLGKMKAFLNNIINDK